MAAGGSRIRESRPGIASGNRVSVKFRGGPVILRDAAKKTYGRPRTPDLKLRDRFRVFGYSLDC